MISCHLICVNNFLQVIKAGELTSLNNKQFSNLQPRVLQKTSPVSITVTNRGPPPHVSPVELCPCAAIYMDKILFEYNN